MRTGGRGASSRSAPGAALDVEENLGLPASLASLDPEAVVRDGLDLHSATVAVRLEGLAVAGGPGGRFGGLVDLEAREDETLAVEPPEEFAQPGVEEFGGVFGFHCDLDSRCLSDRPALDDEREHSLGAGHEEFGQGVGAGAYAGVGGVFERLEGPHGGSAQMRPISIIFSAIWTALSAAPLRMLSATHQMSRVFGAEVSSRMRPTNTASLPEAWSGVG